MSFKTESGKIRALYLLVAFLVALGLWYTLNARDQIERVIDVRLDYRGLPAGLVVTGGQLNKVSVRLRGPKELLRTISNREVSYTFDLSGLTKGSNVIPLNAANHPPELRAYEILEVVPSRMVIEVDQMVEANLPIKVSLRSSPVSPSLRIKDLSVQPSLVTVRGPAGALAGLKEVTAELPVHLEQEDTVQTEEVPVLAPPAVEVFPQSVKVQWKLDVKRRSMNLQPEVLVEGEIPNLAIQPSRASLVVSVPQVLAKDSGYLAQFQVSLPPDMTLPAAGEELTVPLQVATPQGGRVVKLTPPSVTISVREN